ncbi:vitamin K epoxide reductase family protein [Candidatus Parcubacteria bacterium]|nr:vitamin K epoxide reductase family protein [Candidatus Parcubacteria bacterium]
MLFFIANIFLGFAGLLLSLYIAHKKRRKTEHFICPMRGNCHDVIQSDYSKFLGVPVEYLGILYYATMAISYGLRAGFPSLNGPFSIFLLFLSTFAVVFSFYLTFIQLFALRKLCTWCLCSASLTVLIFAFSLASSTDTVFPFLAAAHTPIILIHVVGMALGLGTATLADLFFFKFLKDFRISEMEADVLKIFSQVIWLAIGLIVMSGLGLYLPSADLLLASDAFLMKMIVVGVIILNGAILNLFVAPRFLQIQFGKHVHREGELVQTRRLAFLFGPISVVSWYSAFILGMLDQAPAPFETMWRMYVALLILAVLGGQITERVIDRRAHAKDI